VQGSLSVERMCQLVQVSRAGFYRYLSGSSRAEEETAIRSAVQSIVLDHRWRVTQELRTRGITTNHKRIARIMKEDNLLAVRREWFRPIGSHPHLQALRIYLNLASRMTVLGPNQLWVADITYIRLTCEFVYLAVVLDVFSRKVIGWALGRSLKSKLPACALERAIGNRKPPPGVAHHSDQGVQYTSQEYLEKLRHHQMLLSMSRPSNPHDNATCESFLKTLKREEIYAGAYRNLGQWSQKVEDFIERYYNRLRLHSALDYRSPEKFEKDCREAGSSLATTAPLVTFIRG